MVEKLSDAPWLPGTKNIQSRFEFIKCVIFVETNNALER